MKTTLSSPVPSAPSPAELSVGVLSYRAPATLAQTMESYKRGELAACAGECCVFFNAMTQADAEICARYGWRCAR